MSSCLYGDDSGILARTSLNGFGGPTECLGALSYPAEMLGSVPATHCPYRSGTLHLGVSCNMSETDPFQVTWRKLALLKVSICYAQPEHVDLCDPCIRDVGGYLSWRVASLYHMTLA